MHDVGRVVGDHPAKHAALEQFDRRAAEAGRQHPIERRRRAAALQMAEHDVARFLSGFFLQLGRDHGADATKPLEMAAASLLEQGHRAAQWLGAFGDDDDAELRAEALALAQALDDLVNVVADLRNQDDVGAARHTGV